MAKLELRYGPDLGACRSQKATGMDKVRLQRRLSAIMAADIVGYSRLIENDEAATLAALKALRSDTIDPLLEAIKAVSSS